MDIVLASTSPRRKALLEQIKLSFKVVVSDYEEDMTLDMPPEELVMHLSQGKARSVAEKVSDALVIAADTIVAFEGRVVGKPHEKEDASEMLQKLSGKTHEVLTGLTVIDTAKNKELSRVVKTQVVFRNLSDYEIRTYVASGEPLDKAGAYGIQGLGALLIKEIRGDYYNVIGLPLVTLKEMLEECGVYVLQ